MLWISWKKFQLFVLNIYVDCYSSLFTCSNFYYQKIYYCESKKKKISQQLLISKNLFFFTQEIPLGSWLVILTMLELSSRVFVERSHRRRRWWQNTALLPLLHRFYLSSRSKSSGIACKYSPRTNPAWRNAFHQRLFFRQSLCSCYDVAQDALCRAILARDAVSLGSLWSHVSFRWLNRRVKESRSLRTPYLFHACQRHYRMCKGQAKAMYFFMFTGNF